MNLANWLSLMFSKTIKLIITVALLCWGAAIYALPSDNQKPITLQSDSAEFDHANGTTTYSGSVVMEQGSLKILADKVMIYGDANNVSRVIALGKPAEFSQVPNLGDEPVVASGEKLEYRVDDKVLNLVTNARLKQEGSELTGPKIVYDVEQAVVRAGDSSRNEDGRIRMVIPPIQK